MSLIEIVMTVLPITIWLSFIGLVFYIYAPSHIVSISKSDFMQPISKEELRKNVTLADLPDEVLDWLLEKGEETERYDGEELTIPGGPIDEMWFMTEGKVEFYFDINGRPVHYYTFDMNPPSNGVGGLLPYSRMKVSPGWSYPTGTLRYVKLHKDHFKELEEVSTELVQRLVANMTERARYFATKKLQNEKMSALGRLSAGIAHELNNPASAIQRTVNELSENIDHNYRLTTALLDQNVHAAELHAVYELVNKNASVPESRLTLRQRMDLEDELAGRLEGYGFSEPDVLAGAMVDAGIAPDVLDEIYTALTPDTFRPVMGWLCNILVSARVIKELEQASSRISELVSAMKSHVHMDRSVSLQPFDVHASIDNTLTILQSKMKRKNITVERNYDESLPLIMAYGADLNHIWMNILDNAIDALDQNGNISIATKQEYGNVVVSFKDNGHGIPADIITQIFDPFFTTKKQGEGTGIGLDTAQQIVLNHKGDIRAESVPGKTVFYINLPIHPPVETKDIKSTQTK